MADELQEPKRPGFTPVFDLILEAYSEELKTSVLTTRALVYGQIARHSKMRMKICFAGLETMATEINRPRATFKRHLDVLVEDGWIECLVRSKGGRGKTSQYIPTQKLELLALDKPAQENERVSTLTNNKLAQKNERVSELNPLTSDQNPLNRTRDEETIEETIKPFKETIGSAAEKNPRKEKNWIPIPPEELAERERLINRERLSVAELAKRIAEEKQSNGRTLDPPN